MSGANSLMGAMTTKPRRTKKETEVNPDAYDPRAFDLGLDLIGELQANYPEWKEPTTTITDQETGEEKKVPVRIKRIDLSSYPNPMLTTGDAICAQAFAGNPFGSQASEAVVLRIAASHGIAALYEHPAVELARDVANDYYSDHVKKINDADVRELIADWLRTTRAEITIPGGSKKTKPIYLPEGTANEVIGLAKNLGVTQSSLGVLCIALTFCQQPDEVAHPVHREEWAELVATFLRRIERRAEGTDALIRCFTRKIRVKGRRKPKPKGKGK